MSSKQQMHSLEQFLAQAQGPSVSWADVDDDLEMDATVEEPPAAPADHNEPAPPSSSSRASRYRTSPPVLPQSPPFIIYCGNLSFNCTEQDLVEFFAPLKVRQIRLVVDSHTKRSKGFGYVEFQSRDNMERAFERNAVLLLNRPIRIDVQASRSHEDRPQRHNHHHRPAAAAQPAAPPAERPKLNLMPRTVDASKPSSTTPVPKANPFGAARPREEVLKEKAKAAAGTPTASGSDQSEQAAAAVKRSGSPLQSRAKPAASDSRASQKPAWGPVQSVLSQQQTAVRAAPESSGTPQATSQRQAWGPRGATPRSNLDHSVAEGNGGHRAPDNSHIESKQAGPNRHGPMPAAGHDRRGPVRHQDQERRTTPRQHHNGGAESMPGPRSNGRDQQRPRHRHDDRKASRDKTDMHVSKQAEATEHTATDLQPRPEAADRHRSQSPSCAASSVDDAGFEVQRKGRRNGSGRNTSSSLASTMSKIDLNSSSNRKEKGASGVSGNSRSWAACVQSSPHPDIPSSVSYSSNMFSYLASEED